MRRLSFLYRRPENIDLDVCAYCGDYRQCLDHIPPISYFYDHADINVYLKNGGKLYLIPSCNECNLRLGARPIPDYQGRLAYLYQRYIDLCGKIRWDDDELAELGRNLHSIVAQLEYDRRYFVSKFRGVRQNLASPPEGYEEI